MTNSNVLPMNTPRNRLAGRLPKIGNRPGRRAADSRHRPGDRRPA
jgi:hypothetical protein